MSWKLPRKVENGLFVVWLAVTAGALFFAHQYGNSNLRQLRNGALPEIVIFMIPFVVTSLAFGILFESAVDKNYYGRWARIVGMSMLIMALMNIFVQWWVAIPFGGPITLAVGIGGLALAIWRD